MKGGGLTQSLASRSAALVGDIYLSWLRPKCQESNRHPKCCITCHSKRDGTFDQRDKVIAFILPSSRYLNAIQTMCPHILRYLTTAVITNKDVRKRRQVLKDLVKVIQQVLNGFISRAC